MDDIITRALHTLQSKQKDMFIDRNGLFGKPEPFKGSFIWTKVLLPVKMEFMINLIESHKTRNLSFLLKKVMSYYCCVYLY